MRSRSCNRCERCRMREDLCICSELPTITTKTRVVIVMHKCEVLKSTSTARLLQNILPNCVSFVVGLPEDLPGHSIDLTDELAPSSHPLVLYPETGCKELSYEDSERSTTLIVPDGTWTQAKRILHRREELWRVPRRQLPVGRRTSYTLRRNQAPEGMCTAEAVARALGILEGSARGGVVQDQIESAVRLMVERVTWSRRTSKLFHRC